MTEKVKITQEQADAIEFLRKIFTDVNIIEAHAQRPNSWVLAENESLNGMSLLKLVDALRIGYEVEPEYKEEWEPIEGYENIYLISNFGRVWSLPKEVISTPQGHVRKYKGKFMAIDYSSKGYGRVELSDRGKRKKFLVHRLVAIAFIPNPENKSQVNHKDGNKENNRIDNLEWSTGSENILHAYENGLKEVPVGENHWNSKLSDAHALAIYEKCNSGESRRSLAEDYDVSIDIIDCIMTGKTYRHVTKHPAESIISFEEGDEDA